MPGGSVNGRPFKESRDSFQKTGVPCGNPRRYHTQDVVRMSGQSSARFKDLSGPLEDIETEGERQLKLLLDKQLNTETTIQEQLAQSRQFSRSTLYKPSTEDLSGIVALSNYKSLEVQDQCINELRSCGLTDEEIQLKLKVDKNYVEKRPRLEQEPTYIQSKLDEIDKKITDHKKALSKPDTFTGQTLVGRHAMDLEKSLVRDNIDSKRLSTMLIKNETSSEFPHPDHPMNHIPEILEEVASKKLFEKKRHRRKRKNQLAESSDTITMCNSSDNFLSSLPDSDTIGCKTKEETMAEGSSKSLQHTSISREKAESREQTTTENRNDSFQQTSISSDKADINHESECYVTVGECSTDLQGNNSMSDCKIREGLVHQIPEADIIANRLSLGDIRQIPKFEKYEEGKPNNILYLKNLPNKITENELGSLFLRYQVTDKPPITFRIMTGKMRGQAFVTFNNTETATQALKFLNGYKLHDKPIIIQYGKK